MLQRMSRDKERDREREGERRQGNDQKRKW